MSLLAIENLHVGFPDGSEAVRGLSLEMDKGEMLALVGESGSGKTLTALSILGLLPAEATVGGSVTFDGRQIHNLRDLKTLRGNRVGMIFQEPMSSLNPLHTVRRQILEAYRIHHPGGRGAEAKLTELYAQVGLDYLTQRPNTYPHELSGGERQRVMIAMAIANDPDLLIADEPTTALDVTLQQQILRLLKKLQQERQMAVLLITHDLTVVQKVADKVAVMHAGEIVERGEVKALFAGPKHPYTQMLLAATLQGETPPVLSSAKEVLRTDKLSVTFAVKTPVLRRVKSEVRAVQNISLKLREGETLGIVGESGSGKSSLGFAVLRLVESRGPVVFMGTSLNDLDATSLRRMRQSLQVVFQDPYSSLNPRMMVGDIVAEGLKVHHPEYSPTQVDAEVRAILKQVGMSEAAMERYPHEFSGGQRQRIAIARAMILKPALVVLDEPTSALDRSVQAQVLELLKSLQASHRTSYLFISHDLRVIRAMSHYVLVLKKGEVVEEGPAERLFAQPQHDYTKALMHAAFDETL